VFATGVGSTTHRINDGALIGDGAGPLVSLTATTGITVSTTNSTEGASATNANYQPYITVYMWKRTV